MAEPLTAADLALIRDEIGTSTPPSDNDLRRAFLALPVQHWLPVAIRVLKRRKAAASAGGGASSVTVPGAIAVTLSKADLTTLIEQITDLENRWAEVQGIPGPTGASSSRLVRLTPR